AGDGLSNVLTGWAGSDTFLFDCALGTWNIDQITDFNVAEDRIALDDAIFTTLPLGTLAADAFVTGTAAADVNSRIVYNSSTGAVSYDADGTGGSAMVQFAALSTGLALTNDHFIVV